MKETPETTHIKKPPHKNTSMDYLNEDKRIKKLDTEKPIIKKIFKYLKNKVQLNPTNKTEAEKILKRIEKDKNLSCEQVVQRINAAYENNNPTPPQE